MATEAKEPRGLAVGPSETSVQTLAQLLLAVWSRATYGVGLSHFIF